MISESEIGTNTAENRDDQTLIPRHVWGHGGLKAFNNIKPTKRRRPSSFIIWSRPCSFLRPEREPKSEQKKMQDEYGLWIPLMSSRKDETAVWY